jgi:hypothetical protein
LTGLGLHTGDAMKLHSELNVLVSRRLPSSDVCYVPYFDPVRNSCGPRLLSAYIATIQQALKEACRPLGFHTVQLRGQTAILRTELVLLHMHTLCLTMYSVGL